MKNLVMMMVAAVLLASAMFVPIPASAATLSDYKNVLNDFPSDPVLPFADWNSGHFSAVAYFNYMTVEQCSQANLWREEIKAKDKSLYKFMSGVAYGNGDCVQFDAKKSEKYLLSCFESIESSKNALLALYMNTEVFTDDIANLAYSLASYGSNDAIQYLIEFYRRGKTSEDFYALCLWLGILTERPNQYAPQEYRDLQNKARKWLVTLSKGIPTQHFLKLQEASKQWSLRISENVKNKQDKKQYIENFYVLSSTQEHNYAGILKRNSSELNTKLQNQDKKVTSNSHTQLIKRLESVLKRNKELEDELKWRQDIELDGDAKRLKALSS